MSAWYGGPRQRRGRRRSRQPAKKGLCVGHSAVVTPNFSCRRIVTISPGASWGKKGRRRLASGCHSLAIVAFRSPVVVGWGISFHFWDDFAGQPSRGTELCKEARIWSTLSNSCIYSTVHMNLRARRAINTTLFVIMKR